jgi:hypothetical protein
MSRVDVCANEFFQEIPSVGIDLRIENGNPHRLVGTYGYCSIAFGEADNAVDIQGIQKCLNKASVGRRCYVDTLISEMHITI